MEYDKPITLLPRKSLHEIRAHWSKEISVYTALLCLIWAGNGPIQLDKGRLGRRCGMPKSSFSKAAKGLIEEGKIIRAPDNRTNKTWRGDGHETR